ncbi:hypothetical protein ACN28C_04875 [Plantactinospora sp. WMMC1484]|uniref:LIC_10091 family protein n=1 Tax=Plantactinospora sp. WMMC1484 TaxID=3404122 RepID=UPI003BF605A5
MSTVVIVHATERTGMPHPAFDDAVRRSLHTAVEPSNYRLDCFVTNELAYNDVLTRCWPTGTTGGYVGVGPCQNLTYVGALRPRCAVIVDSRLDNVLLHLIFKLIMERATNPVEYLATLLSRQIGAPSPGQGPDFLISAVEAGPASAELFDANLKWLTTELSGRWPLTEMHQARVAALYEEFFRRQLDITNVDAPTAANLDEAPTLREVIRARTSRGVNLHFLTDSDRYDYVRQMHLDGRIIPILGNVGTAETVDRVNELLRTHDEALATLYVSNVEEHVLVRYRIENERLVDRPNPEGLLIDPYGAAYDEMLAQWGRLDAERDALLIRFFFPGTFGDRSFGVFPYLQPDVRRLGSFLRDYREHRPKSVFETYL